MASDGELRQARVLSLLVLTCVSGKALVVNQGYEFGQLNHSPKFLDKETKTQEENPPKEYTLVIDPHYLHCPW